MFNAIVMILRYEFIIPMESDDDCHISTDNLEIVENIRRWRWDMELSGVTEPFDLHCFELYCADDDAKNSIIGSIFVQFSMEASTPVDFALLLTKMTEFSKNIPPFFMWKWGEADFRLVYYSLGFIHCEHRLLSTFILMKSMIFLISNRICKLKLFWYYQTVSIIIYNETKLSLSYNAIRIAGILSGSTSTSTRIDRRINKSLQLQSMELNPCKYKCFKFLPLKWHIVRSTSFFKSGG